MSVAQAVARASRALAPHSDSPRLDAELLLSSVLGVTRAGLLTYGGDLAEEGRRRFQALLDRRAAGTPVAYLLGVREFWSREFHVTPAVLVPRPETELLVERALECKDAAAACRVLDLGTGSGAIAVSIAGERPGWRLTAVDLSAEALEVAQGNAMRNGCTGIEWLLGSWFEPLAGRRFDLVVGNPPYVSAADPALLELRAEPALALTPGPTGLEALAAIIAAAGEHLEAAGVLLLEHGNQQAAAVSDLLKRHGFRDIRTHMDLSGNPRVTQGTIHSQP